eukprot:jgi/Tetstr1/436321/TSEL_025159.t1
MEIDEMRASRRAGAKSKLTGSQAQILSRTSAQRLQASHQASSGPIIDFSVGHNFTYLEDVVDALADRLLKAAVKQDAQKPGNNKYMVGIAGPPGGGKSTLSLLMKQRIDELAPKYGVTTPVSIAVPMDGFHYYRKQLDAMEDPVAARFRRGAHWTFDAEAFVACLNTIVAHGEVSAPSFSHGTGDPVEDDIHVEQHHRIVIVEGNYLLLDLPPWDQLRPLFDETWFVGTNLDVAMDRVYTRQTGNGVAPEVSRGRVDGNDRPNGELVMETRRNADIVIPELPLRPTLQM